MCFPIVATPLEIQVAGISVVSTNISFWRTQHEQEECVLSAPHAAPTNSQFAPLRSSLLYVLLALLALAHPTTTSTLESSCYISDTSPTTVDMPPAACDQTARRNTASPRMELFAGADTHILEHTMAQPDDTLPASSVVIVGHGRSATCLTNVLATVGSQQVMKRFVYSNRVFWM
jgi:hypothetical protein